MLHSVALRNIRGSWLKFDRGQAAAMDVVHLMPVAALLAIAAVVVVNIWLGTTATPFD